MKKNYKKEKTEKADTPELKDCISCRGKCCRHVALEIDKPTCKRDYDNIRWYLMHEKIRVFIDQDGSWTLEFLTNCSHLKRDYKCDIYQKRPKLCRKYPKKGSNCEFLGDGFHYIEIFTCPEEFEQYLNKKHIDWKWKGKFNDSS